MNHPDEALLHDFLDDELPADTRAFIAAHLGDCSSCRRIVVGARSLREQAARAFAGSDEGGPGLGGDETDVPDQWPSIEARIHALRQSGTERGPALPPSRPLPTTLASAITRLPSTRPWLRAAAGVLIVLVPSATAFFLLRSGRVAETPLNPPAGATVAASPLDASGDAPATAIAVAYAPVFVELERILAEGRGRLQPETITTLEENLAILNAAIGSIQEALSADPAHRGNLRSLDDMYQAKLGLLRQAVTLASGA